MAGLGPATHDFTGQNTESRGWPAFAGHDTGGALPVNHYVTWYDTRCVARNLERARNSNDDVRAGRVRAAAEKAAMAGPRGS